MHENRREVRISKATIELEGIELGDVASGTSAAEAVMPVIAPLLAALAPKSIQVTPDAPPAAPPRRVRR